jgi:alpha-tubulin suppressor-like RCC1 family protein
MPFIKNVTIFARKGGGGSGPSLPSPTCAVSAGEHSLYSNSTGRVWGWGYNFQGQVGNNTNIDVATPVSILGTAKTFLKIAAGQNHSIAIDKNGRLWGWGLNGQGQIGDNSVTNRCTPVSVAGVVKTIYEISAGSNHSNGIDNTGLVWSWGFNSGGQLGDNTIISKNTPVSILGARKTFCKISSGETHTLALTNRGAVWAWGNANTGRLGDNQQVTNRCTPVSVLGTAKTFCKISAGSSTSYGIDKNGRLWGWGTNSSGQIGNNSTGLASTPVSILGAVKTFCEISGGGSYALALDKNGRAWGWGYNGAGGIGDNSTTQRNTPVSVAGSVKTFCRIDAGHGATLMHSLAIDKNGGVWAWGDYTFGKLGIDSPSSRRTPASIRGATKTFCMVSAGFGFSGVIDNRGRVWSWGSNPGGQLGDNSLTSRATPVSILGAVKTFCQIAVSGLHMLALDQFGRAWSWGNASSGRLGDNQIATNRCTPVSVLGTTKTFCRIAVGCIGAHSLAIDRYGRAWSWGNAGNGRLGDNQIATNRCTPVSVLGTAKTFCQIAGGNTHSLAIDRYGRVWAWGSAQNGRLGDNQVLTSRLTPVSVLGTAKTFCQIAGGQTWSMAIDRYMQVWAWGNNSSGQLGDNSVTSRLTPVSVLGARKTFCQISAGAAHSLALDNRGRVWGWGDNSSAQLGDGTITSARTPVLVGGVTKTFCRISAGNSHSTAIDRYGRTWTWGVDTGGQLGQNGISRLTPVRVCVI